ncbi:MAG: amidohydrolase [Armatimonadota bacterium]|nr:amidohydrolase [Armatimonadota bacterium]
MIYRAKHVLPITSGPINDGEVLIRGDRIEAVGVGLSRSHPEEPVHDLGDAILMPGLVNSHAHLDYTMLRGAIDDLPLFPWVRRLTEYARAMTAEDYRWSSLLGAAECIQAGITTVADATPSGASLDALLESGLRGIVYQEVFGHGGDDPSPAIDALKSRLDLLVPRANGRVRVGISPHTVYTASAELLTAVRSVARQAAMPVCIHVAESTSEYEFCVRGTGEIAEFYEALGEEWPCPGVSPVQYLYDLGVLGETTLAAHCVHVGEDDIRILAVTRTGVAHCPRSNAKIGVGIAPVADMLKVGVRLGLGTDSAVSNNSLDICGEMRSAALLQRISGANHGWTQMDTDSGFQLSALSSQLSPVGAEAIVEAATIGGARALGMESSIGSLEPGKKADLAAIDLSRAGLFPNRDPYSTLVYCASGRDAILTVVNGEAVYERGELKTLDLAAIKRNVAERVERVG